MQDVEFLIISCLLHNKEYSSKVYPHTKKEYFESEEAKALFELIATYQAYYGSLPTKEAMKVELSNMRGVPQKLYEELEFQLQCLYADDTPQMANEQKLDWILDQT